VRVLGDDKAKTTFIPCEDDLEKAKRLIASSESAGQGKFCFLEAPSGSGKSTFVHSLEIFMSDKVGQVVRLPQPHELKLSDIPGHIAGLKRGKKFTVVNFDNREAPLFNPPEYQTFLGELNGVLRSRRIYWCTGLLPTGLSQQRWWGCLKKSVAKVRSVLTQSKLWLGCERSSTYRSLESCCKWQIGSWRTLPSTAKKRRT
jgi:energy-coupling factor transporter ATP-binding protein EcfA2